MARKQGPKDTQVNASETSSSTSDETPVSTEIQSTPPGETAQRSEPPAAHDRTQESPKQWVNPYRAILTCPIRGFELGENRRFKQLVFSFPEDPGSEITAKLKEAGYKYRTLEKSWTIAGNAANREAAIKLAMELKGESQSRLR